MIGNIVSNPEEEKFRKLKFSNPKIQEFIFANVECVNLLEILHFKEKRDVVSSDQGLQGHMEVTKQDVVDNLNDYRSVMATINSFLKNQ